MKRVPLTVILTACMTACMTACATAPEHAPSKSPSSAADDRAATDAASASFTRPVEADAASQVPLVVGQAHAHAASLRIWNDPEFKQRFAESFLAETEIEPELSPDERTTMLEAQDHVDSDELDEAVQVLEENRTETSSARLDLMLGNIWFEKDRLDRAAEECRLAISKFPKFRRAWSCLAQVCFKQDDYARAVQAFTKVITLGGGDAITFGLLGVAHSRRGDAIAAESAFRQAAMLDPDSKDWKMGLAESLFRQRRYADAVALFDTLITEQPDRADLWLLQAEAWAQLGKPLEAAENFEIVDDLGGSTSDTLSTLGDIYANQELYDLAVDAYVRALHQGEKPNPRRAIRAAGFLSGRDANAETGALLDAVESACGDGLGENDRKEVLRLRARLALKAGAGDEEARILEEIVALDPLDGDALLALGDHSRSNGDVQQAIFYYERAARLPDFEADAKVHHGQLLVGQDKLDEALPLLRSAQQLKPRQRVQDYLDAVERIAKKR